MPRKVFLPIELLTDIFSRLPVKYLIRCTLVCKSWCLVIKSPDFLSAQIGFLKTINCNDNLLLLKENSYSVLSDITFEEVDRTYHPFLVKPGRELILSSCNGLVCLALRLFSGWVVILWNPSVRKCKMIDKLDYSWNDTERSDDWFLTGREYGLGWHDTGKEFRVVKIANGSCIGREVSVYNLKTESWHLFDGVQVPNIMFGWRHAFVNGSIHWITLSNNVDFAISAFNLEDESFKEIMLPPINESALSRDGDITEMNGSLAFIDCRRSPFSLGNSSSIWLMTEYGVVESWTKLFTFMMTAVIERPLGFTKSGRLICKISYRRPLFVSCNFENRALEHFAVEWPCGVVVNFMETAVLL